MGTRTILLTTLTIVLLTSPAYAQETYPTEDITREQGDIVVIPAGTLHGWVMIPDHVTYLSIRTDPHSALPAGYVREGLE